MMRRIYSTFFMIICLASYTSVESSIAQVSLPAKKNFYLFLLVGQSNMAGRGVVAPEDKVPHKRVLSLNKEDKWVPAVDPIHFDKPIAGVWDEHSGLRWRKRIRISPSVLFHVPLAVRILLNGSLVIHGAIQTDIRMMMPYKEQNVPYRPAF